MSRGSYIAIGILGVSIIGLVGCTTQEEKMQIWRNKSDIEELRKEIEELKVIIEKIAPPSEKELLSQRIKRLINQLDSDDILARYEAGRELKEIGKPAVPYLVQSLRDKRAKVRMGAIIVLGEIRDKSIVPEVIKVFEESESKKDKSALALLLGRLRDKKASQVLIEGLNSSSNTIVGSCATALGMLKEEKAVPKLVKLLTHKNKNLRQTVRRALVRIGKKGLPGLEESLNSQDPQERLEVVKVLERIDDSDYLLEKALNDRSKYIKIYAAYILDKRGNEKGKAVARSLIDDPDPKVSNLAKEILKKDK